MRLCGESCGSRLGMKMMRGFGLRGYESMEVSVSCEDCKLNRSSIVSKRYSIVERVFGKCG